MIMKELIGQCVVDVWNRHGKHTEHHVFPPPRRRPGKKKAQITISRITPSGQKIIERVFPMDSFVANVGRIFEIQLGQVSVSLTDTSGTPRTQAPMSIPFKCDAAAADSTYGIVVGTGTTAVALDDTKLQTQIAHGNGAGQLAYGAMQSDAPVNISDTTSFVLKRRFTNNTGSTITVKEIAIYINGVSFKYCILREVIGAGVGHDVPAGVTTEFAITIPVTLASGCFTGLFDKMLYTGCVSTSQTYNDTGGVSRTVGSPVGWNATAAAGDATRGVVVGTGTNAVAHADTKLQTQIAHGSGGGQLNYQATLFDPTVVSGTKSRAAIKRVLNNLTGSDITMNEGGIYVVGGGGSWIFCIARVKFGTGVTVTAGGLAQCKFLAGIEQV